MRFIIGLVFLIVPLAAFGEQPKPVEVTNFPDTQNVTGAVEVVNLPDFRPGPLTSSAGRRV